MENSDVRTPRTLYFWLAALVLAWAVDFLFWGQAAGLSFAIWIALGVAGLFVAAVWEGKRPAPASYPLALLSLALACTVFLRSEPFSIAISGLLALLLLGLLAATLTSGHWPLYRIGDFLLAGLKVAVAALMRGGQSLARKSSPEGELPAKTAWSGFRRSGLPVLRGLLLALPVVAILAALLAAADPVFSRLLANVLKVFDFERLPEYIFRLTYVLVLTYCFSGVLIHAIFPEPVETRPTPNQPWKTRFLGATETAVILGSVVALFAIFVALQVRYLFGGQANIHETGFTYAEYARRGFFELVWVAVLSLGLYVGLGAVTRRETPRQERAFTLLSIALLGLVLVILASALQRLLLYEHAYGFTRLRIYTHIFIPWLAALLVTAMILQAVGRPGHLGFGLLLVAVGFGLTFAVVNVDGLIARLDLQRAQAGQELDAHHLASLSNDATPTLVRAYQDPAYSAAQHDALGAVLACRQAGQPTTARGWRGYRLSESRAAALLNGLDLSLYPVKGQRYEAYVQLKNEQLFCQQLVGD